MSKRAVNEAEDTTDARGTKRRKVRSCSTCRKQKARCEFTSSAFKCHRCTVLNIVCIFEGDRLANPSSTNTQANSARSTQPTTRTETRGPLMTLSGAPMRQYGRESSVEDRLSAIEEALRQVLRATGLPTLELISFDTNGALRSGPPSTTSSFGLSLNGSSRPMHDGVNSVPLSSTSNSPRRGRLLYSTPLELGYITDAQSTELAAIFEMRYNHCVYTPILKSHRITLERPFTFTVMCALALRLKTTIPNQPNICDQVSRLLESHLRTAMGARTHSIDSIHAFLLMSLWGSVLLSKNPGPETFAIPDGWLLLSMAIHMAQSLRLDHSADDATSLIQHGKQDSRECEIALEKARVWYTLITYDLAMSVGLVRPRLITALNISQTRSLIGSFARSLSDQCLAYHLDALLLVHRFHDIVPPAVSAQISEFTTAVDGIIHELEVLSNTARNSSLQYGDNQALCTEYRMFHIYEQYCECVCLSKACAILISPPLELPMYSSDSDQLGADEGEQVFMSSTLALLWVGRICSMAENVINGAFPPNFNDPAFLSSAPDHLFTILAFCAVTLIQSQVTVLRYCWAGLDRGREYDDLVERVIKSLTIVALPDSQLPRRYAKVLSTMLQALKKQKQDQTTRRLARSQPQGHSNGTSTNGTADSTHSNGGDLLALAAAVMQEKADGSTPSHLLNGYVVPSIHKLSSFLDPSTWLEDPSLDRGYFGGD